mmetsp:Transcript_20940/g.66686  ORF Transcript_20940/g.66686 Transcript_20940/m.66686 type:complete len:224 (+) Transcript_20940:215-886(+)
MHRDCTAPEQRPQRGLATSKTRMQSQTAESQCLPYSGRRQEESGSRPRWSRSRSAAALADRPITTRQTKHTPHPTPSRRRLGRLFLRPRLPAAKNGLRHLRGALVPLDGGVADAGEVVFGRHLLVEAVCRLRAHRVLLGVDHRRRHHPHQVALRHVVEHLVGVLAVVAEPPCVGTAAAAAAAVPTTTLPRPNPIRRRPPPLPAAGRPPQRQFCLPAGARLLRP